MPNITAIATQDASKGVITTHQQIEVSVESGLKGDYRGESCPRSQVTLLSSRNWALACAEVGAELEWTERGANLLVDDIEFNDAMIGQQIQIGTVLLKISSETEPCSHMEVLQPGLQNALTRDWRGGASCMVLRDGIIKVGDNVNFLKRV